MQHTLPADAPRRIRRLREQFDLTQSRLAALLGVSVASIIRWEQGQARPSRIAWQHILRAEAEGGRSLGLAASPLPASPESQRSAELPIRLLPAPIPAIVPTNLRLQVTSFIGRERELDEVRRLLAHTRLLTVTGPGGAGKTRLALEAVNELIGDRGERGQGTGTRGDRGQGREGTGHRAQGTGTRGQGGHVGPPLPGYLVGADQRVRPGADPAQSSVLSPQSRAGVWLVELAAVGDPAHVIQLVASTLGVRELANHPLAETLEDFLRTKQLILILDNCEHLIPACAALVDSLIHTCPDLHVLATSREPLGIAGETTWQIPPLSMPPEGNRDVREQGTGARGNREQGTGNRGAGAVTQSSVLSPQSSTESSVLSPQSSSEAVRLFVERAQAVQPAFTLTEANGPVIARICRRLDGIPLGIELAAARVRMLPVEQILERLEDRFQLLASGSLSAPARQQTLQATMDWSYALLSESERTLFRRLSVFAHGFRLEAAEEVAGDEGTGTRGNRGQGTGVFPHPSPLSKGEGIVSFPTQSSVLSPQSSTESSVLSPQPSSSSPPSFPGKGAGGLGNAASVLDLLSRLVEKSLVLMEARDGVARYRLLETMRQYGQERLAESGEAEAIQRRHARYCLSLAETAEPKLNGRDEASWMARLKEEYDDLRAALAWCTLAGEDPETGLRLAGVLALSGFWLRRGYLSEGRAWSQRALQAGGNRWPRARAKVLTGAGTLARHQGDHAAARSLAERSLEVWQELGDGPGTARALSNLGNLAGAEGELDRARDLHEESLKIERESDNAPGIASALENLAHLARREGDYTRAQALLSESLGLRRKLGSRGALAALLTNLALIFRDRGAYAEAQGLFEEGLTIAREQHLDWGIGLVLANLGLIAGRKGDQAAAGALYRESLELRTRLGDTPGVAECLAGLARVAADQGRLAPAARLLAATRVLLAELSAPLPDVYQEDCGHVQTLVRAGLSEAAFTVASTVGQALPLEQAVTYAIEVTRVGDTTGRAVPPADPSVLVEASPPDTARLTKSVNQYANALTRREHEVLRLLAAGRTNPEIARELVVSVRTVENHVANVYVKIGVHSRAEAIAHALRRVTVLS